MWPCHPMVRASIVNAHCSPKRECRLTVGLAMQDIEYNIHPQDVRCLDEKGDSA